MFLIIDCGWESMFRAERNGHGLSAWAYASF